MIVCREIFNVLVSSRKSLFEEPTFDYRDSVSREVHAMLFPPFLIEMRRGLGAGLPRKRECSLLVFPANAAQKRQQD